MKKLIILIILFTIINLYSKNLTSSDLINLTKISDFHISPDGKYTALVVSLSNIKDNNSVSNIYLINNVSKDTIKLTNTDGHNYSPFWQPNSNNLYFLSDRSGSSQIWKININGGEAQMVTDIIGGVSNPIFSPKGTYLAYSKDVKLEKTIKEKDSTLDKANALIYDDLMIRHWDTWRDESWSHIYIYNLLSKDTADIMLGELFDAPLSPFGGREQFEFSPDEKELAYTCKKVKDYQISTNSDIYVYNIESKSTKNISEGMNGYDMDPRYSPDGKYITFHSMKTPGYEADKNRIMLYDRNSKQINELTLNLDQPASKTKWSLDSKKLYFQAPSGEGTNTIYSIDLKGNYTKLLNNDKLTLQDYGLRGFDLTNNFIILSVENWNNPPELYQLPIGKSNESLVKISDFNNNFNKEYKKCEIQSRIIKAEDGKNIQTWVIYPPDFDPNKKYPVLTYCQGGPQQQISQYFSFGWSMFHFAHKGYIVIAPNRRGCPGFGQEWTDAINQDYGGMPAKDIMMATKVIMEEKYIDSKRIAAVGASAGGYMAFWLAGNDNGLYSAFISHCGIFNLISKYGATEELFFPNYDNGGAWWENREYYEKNSPHNFVKNWKKPMLIITGEKDYRVSYTQSLEAFTTARSLGVPARLLHFPEQNHWILKPQEQLLWYNEFFRFLDDYLK